MFGDKINDGLISLFTPKINLSTPVTALPSLNIDSLLYAIVTDLGLDSGQLVVGYNGAMKNMEKKYPRYLIKWPQIYPLVWFTQTIQSACRTRDSLRYDAIELENGQKLNLVFIEKRDTLGLVELAADSRYKPAVSNAAIVFKDFDMITKSQIISLVKSGIPFGYILNPEKVPDNDIAKILKTCRGECYLRLPADKERWSAIMKKVSFGGSGKGGKFNDKNLATILHRFPIIDGFFFDESKGVDKATVKAIVKQATEMNLFYVKFEKSSGTIDTVLAENLIKVGVPKKLVDLTGLSLAEFVSRFKADFSKPAIHPKIIYLIAGRADYFIAVDDLARFRNSWNIKMAPPTAQLEFQNPR